MQNTQKRPLYYLPVVLFLAVVFGLGAVAVIAAMRTYENIIDLVIKIITGWAALAMALFGPFVVITLAWGRVKTRYKKLTGVLAAALAIAVAGWLLRYILLFIF